jgi:hypothetical protein
VKTERQDGLPEVPAAKETWFAIYWRKAGGGSLVLSVVVHLVMLGTASFIVTSVVRDKSVNFLSGGGTKAGQAASQDLAHQLKTKQRTALNRAVPLRKVVSLSNTAAIALPELPPIALDLPQMSSILGGNMGSAGFASSGAGGGYGSGVGIGGMRGRSLKPIVMFGKNTGAHSIAVILDVSGSMTPHLSQVIEELDRVAKGSPVLLYVGCGVGTPPEGVHIDDTSTPTRFPQFKAYWQADHGPEEDVYNILQRRPFTYFIKSQGIQYAWVSLLATEVRHAEALYWFSDFQDDVDEKQIESVLTNLKRRKQKLFIHASEKGNEFERIRDKLCLPSGGLAIEGGR